MAQQDTFDFRKEGSVSIWLLSWRNDEIPSAYLAPQEGVNCEKIFDAFANSFQLGVYDKEEIEFTIEWRGRSYHRWLKQNLYNQKARSAPNIGTFLRSHSYHDAFLDKAIEAAESRGNHSVKGILLIYDFQYQPELTRIDSADGIIYLGAFQCYKQHYPYNIERTDWLSDPTFWAVHYARLLEYREMQDYFGRSSEELDHFWKAMERYPVPTPNLYPCFYIQLPVSESHDFKIAYHAYPDDFTILYTIESGLKPDDLEAPRIKQHRFSDVPLLLPFWQHIADDENLILEIESLRCEEALDLQKAVAHNTDNPLLQNGSLPLILPQIAITGEDDLKAFREYLFNAWSKLNIIKSSELDGFITQIINELSV
jgi:hypothetical protein